MNLFLIEESTYGVRMRLAAVKPFFEVVALLMLLGVAVVIGVASWRLATRPKAIGWSSKQIGAQLTKGMPRSEVLKLLGPPHSKSERDGWHYANSYLSRAARHHSETPSHFAIFFKDDKVDLILSAYDY